MTSSLPPPTTPEADANLQLREVAELRATADEYDRIIADLRKQKGLMSACVTPVLGFNPYRFGDEANTSVLQYGNATEKLCREIESEAKLLRQIADETEARATSHGAEIERIQDITA